MSIVSNNHASGMRLLLFHLTKSIFMLHLFPTPKDKCHSLSLKLLLSLLLSLMIQKRKFLYHSPTSNPIGPNLHDILHNFLGLHNLALMDHPLGSKSKNKMVIKHVILSFSSVESSYDSRAEDHKQSGPSKPKKLKKKSYKSKYQELWSAEFLSGSANQNKHTFYFIPCKKNIPCDNQGRAVVRHRDWSAHKKMASW